MTDIEDLDLPDCLTLWRCIGCGAMGNAAECTGDCDFQRRFVVDAEVHPAHIMTLASNTIMIFFMQFLLSSLS